MKTNKILNDGTEIVYHIRGESHQTVIVMGRPPLCGSYYLDAPHRQGLFDKLNKAGWAVVLFDPAGLWKSGKADQYDHQRWLSDLQAVVREITHQRVGIWGTTLAGWSVLKYGLSPESKVDRLVLEWPAIFLKEDRSFASAREKGDGDKYAEELRAPTVDYFMKMEKVYEAGFWFDPRAVACLGGCAGCNGPRRDNAVFTHVGG